MLMKCPDPNECDETTEVNNNTESTRTTEVLRNYILVSCQTSKDTITSPHMTASMYIFMLMVLRDGFFPLESFSMGTCLLCISSGSAEMNSRISLHNILIHLWFSWK